MPVKNLHWIGMNGSRGCMPDFCAAYDTRSAPVEELANHLELTDAQRKELDDVGIVECVPDQGAAYAEIQECNCDKPWEHTEGDDPSNWPTFVREHVQAFLDTLEKIEYSEYLANRTWEYKTFYLLPYASFGDYDNSTFVERANAKDFKESFDFVSQRFPTYGVNTGIDQDDIDAISFEQLQELITVRNGLADYPIINEETMSILELEAQIEAWRDWGLSDFRRELIKHFGNAYEEHIENLPDELLTDVFYKAADKANEYWESESGGSVFIRIERIVAKGNISLESLGLLPLDTDDSEVRP
jgi:hypothetical protein